MAMKLHRCSNTWAKFKGHPCWKVQKALDDTGIDYELVLGPWPSRKKREAVIAGTGQAPYPAIEFEDGSWYREASSDMEQRSARASGREARELARLRIARARDAQPGSDDRAGRAPTKRSSGTSSSSPTSRASSRKV